MNGECRAAVIGALIAELRAAGSWCGETHVQKSIYVLQEGLHVPMRYGYILYKHGPYSFELKSEMAGLIARGLLRQEFSSPPYGPRLAGTDVMETHFGRYAGRVGEHSSAIQQVARFFRDRGVAELEVLSTALYVTVSNRGETAEKRAERIHGLKPHVSRWTALGAVKELDEDLFLREQDAAEIGRASCTERE